MIVKDHGSEFIRMGSMFERRLLSASHQDFQDRGDLTSLYYRAIIGVSVIDKGITNINTHNTNKKEGSP
jgi:hypothetical protein